LIVKHETKRIGSYDIDYDDEALEHELELNYDMSASYAYEPDANNETSTDFLNTDNTTTCKTDGGSASAVVSVTQTYIDDLMERKIAKNTEYCLVPFYLLVLIFSMITTGLLAVQEISESLGMAVLCGFTFCGALCGMYGVFGWSAFNDVLSYLQLRNAQYSQRVDRLRDIGEVLQNDADVIHASIDGLKRDGQSLQSAMSAYSELQRQVKEICAQDQSDGTETMQQLLDTVNKQCDELNTIIRDNERAHLLSIFYSVRMYDYGHGNKLTRAQYELFLARCNQNTRAKFESYGGFDAMCTEQKGLANMQHFEELIRSVLYSDLQHAEREDKSTIKLQTKL